MTNKKFQAIIKDLFIRCKKLNISLLFITQSYFSVPKEARSNSTHYLIMKLIIEKIYNKLPLIIQQILITKTFLQKIYRNCTKEPYSFFIIDVQNPTKKFRNNFSDSPL